MRADRLLWLMLSLQTEGRLTAQVLAARFEVSERTIYRDVEALATAGVPVYTQSGAHGGIFLDEHYRTSLTGLSLTELRALFLSSDGGPLRDLGLTHAIQGTNAKLLAALPTTHQAEVQRLRQRFYIDSDQWFDYSNAPSILPDLQRAVWEDVTIEATYSNYEGQTSNQRLEPYALVAKASAWYLIGRVSDGRYRTYRVARISRVTVTNTPFERDCTFDLVAYWRAMSRRFKANRETTFPFYPVILRIAPRAFEILREYIPQRYEQIALQDDGWLVMRVMFLSLHEAHMHVLGLGTAVSVVEPATLYEAVMNTAHALVAQHEYIPR